MTWDEYYHKLCVTVASNTKCLSRTIGAVLVRDKSIISTGYNGPPRGVPHCGSRFIIDPKLRALLISKDMNPNDPALHDTCPRYVAGFKSGEGLEWCVAGHAERNAIVNAARSGACTMGATLYMDCGIPCTPCLVEIINSGIEEIVVTKMIYYDLSAEYTLENSDLRCRVYSHLIGERNEN